MCKEWQTAHELGSVVTRSLNRLKKVSPGIGWIRGDQALGHDASAEILRLRKRIDELESAISDARSTAPTGTERLAQGEDSIEIKFNIEIWIAQPFERVKTIQAELVSWNQVFYHISPLLIDECSEPLIRKSLGILLSDSTKKLLLKAKGKRRTKIDSCELDTDSFQTIIVQLRALGLITRSNRPRSVKDRLTYWTLTPYGDTVMNRRYAQKLCMPSSGSAFDHLNSVLELYSFDHLGQALRSV